jgi:hypothetical protein
VIQLRQLERILGETPAREENEAQANYQVVILRYAPVKPVMRATVMSRHSLGLSLKVSFGA